MEPALLRVLESRPDSVVDVLVRLNRDLVDADRARLEQNGLKIGSMRGRLVTGSLRAASARRLSGLEQVLWIELAGTVGTNRNNE